MTTQEEFWSRASLAHVRDHARASMVSPWSLLGSVLARVACSTDADVVLPPIIGGPASLNLVVALVGSSAAGKDTTESAARACTDLPDVSELPLGSGEGVARTFAPPPPPRKDQPPAEQITRALLTATEVDTVSAIASRQGSTLMPVLRQLYSGSTLGAANSAPDRRVIIPAHTYRACVVIGVQPERAGVLASDTAGTRQRVLWMPTADHDTPEITPDAVAPLHVERDLRARILGVPADIVELIRAHRRAVLREDPDIDLGDGHRMLTRLKVAAALMLLDSRPDEITAEDWELAGAVMRVSDATRARVDRVLAEDGRAANRARAHATAERDNAVAERRVQRAAAGILARLERADGPVSLGVLRKALRSDLRPEFQPAMDRLHDAGSVVETAHGYVGGGQPVHPVHPRSDAVIGCPPDPSTCPPDADRGGQVDNEVDSDNPRSDGVDRGGQVDGPPPGAPTATTPGMTARVLDIINRQTGTEA
ncbi:hypothetical protein [Gordonia bronchialis]|uniref:hypothetical protein n=1 Tax=Gordonia bronchialis TaxID=2054 RepID=UPI00226E0A66|nr:hypothetical protein [Gordonia bronchialis]